MSENKQNAEIVENTEIAESGISTLENQELIAFKAISNFVISLGDLFSENQRTLALYKRLIEKTTLSHSKAIRKHLDVFKTFCTSNRQAIKNKDDKIFKINEISYSDKVFVDMKHIFDLADNETKEIIWTHILTISALIDPSNRAKELLKKNMEAKNARGESGNEELFLSGIIDKIENNVGERPLDPMQAVSSIMGSGIFGELMGSMNNGLSSGSLDISKLMGAVQGMISGFGQDPAMSNMIGTMMNSLKSSDR